MWDWMRRVLAGTTTTAPWSVTLGDRGSWRSWNIAKRPLPAPAWRALPAAVRESVQAGPVDMWQPFLNAARAEVPHAWVVDDKFHVMRYTRTPQDLVRRQEHRTPKTA
jgi:hypothetical protein